MSGDLVSTIYDIPCQYKKFFIVTDVTHKTGYGYSVHNTLHHFSYGYFTFPFHYSVSPMSYEIHHHFDLMGNLYTIIQTFHHFHSLSGYVTPTRNVMKESSGT